MIVTLTSMCVFVLLLAALLVKRKRERHEMEQHSITPEALQTLLYSLKSRHASRGRSSAPGFAM